jgi:hypothetical protein
MMMYVDPVWTLRLRQIDYITSMGEKDKLTAAAEAQDLPAFQSMYDLDTWKTVGPPLGTVYNYPPRGDEQTSIAGALKLDEVIKWAENELEGTLRA